MTVKNVKFDKQPFKGCLSFFKDNVLLGLGIIITFSLCMYCILGTYGFSAYPDEFGYWTPAAAVKGYDWSEITSLGSYYSYGYSVLLWICLTLFNGAISTYRAAIVLNLIMQCTAVPLIYHILTDLFPTADKNTRQIASVISILYPAWVYYTQTTMAESLLYFLFVLTAYLVLSFFKKPGALKAVLLILTMVYCYFVHMRCMGVIGAGAATIVIWIFSRRSSGKFGKKVWLIPIFIGVLFVASFYIKSFVIGRLYNSASDFVLSWNDYASVPERLLRIVTGDGAVLLLKDIAGKVLYLGLATYGIGYFAIGFLVKECVNSVRNIIQKKSNDRDFLVLYIFLAVLAQFMVALLYLNGASSSGNERLDIFLHGRYIDFFLPILFGIGIMHMTLKKNIVAPFLICMVIIGGCYVVARNVIAVNESHMRNIHGFTMIGMSYMLNDSSPTETLKFLINETILGSCLTFGVIVLIAAYRKFRHDVVLLLIIVPQVVLALVTIDKFVFPQQAYIYGDIIMGAKLKEVRQQYSDRNIVAVYDGGAPYIELVQFEDRQADIHVINREFEWSDISPYISDDNILILSETCPELEYALDYYDGYWDVGHMVMLYKE